MAERSFRAVLWTLALTGLLLDQASKYGVFHWLAGGEGHAYVLFGTEASGFRLIAQFEQEASGAWRPHVNHGALFGFLRTPAFREHAAELKGYDVAETGQVRHVN